MAGETRTPGLTTTDSAALLPSLARVVLFADFPHDDLTALAARVRRRRFARGDVIFRRRDPGQTLYIIESGAVRISLDDAERGRHLVLALLGPGDFFGELALLDGDPRSADALAHEPSELLALDRQDFLHFVVARPTATERLLAVLSRRLRQDTQVLQDAAFLDVPARLARALLELAQPDRGQEREPGWVTPHLTQMELAGIVGTTRETVNKWLGVFERQGLIRRQRGRFRILREDGLRRRIY